MRMMMAVLALATVTAGSARGQNDQEAVLSVVKQLFNGMRTRDTALMRAQFAPQARLLGLATKEGKTAVEVLDPSLWIGAAGRSTGAAWDERIFDPVVQTDANVAHVWTYYEFWLGPKLSHCGYDSFVLVKLDLGWKISQVADTRRNDCKPR